MEPTRTCSLMLRRNTEEFVMKIVFMGRLFKGATAVAATLILAACSLAPAYHVPSAPADAAFKEMSPAWSQEAATPPGEGARGEWCKISNDAALDNLERQALEANQDLKAASARVKEARALNQVARSAFFPTLDAGLGATRQQTSAASQGLADGTHIQPSTVYRAQANVSYEVDLFGRVASSVDAARADTQRSEALFRSVQLALQADVAVNYFALRELDAEAEVLTQTVDLREQAWQLMKVRFKEGAI